MADAGPKYPVPTFAGPQSVAPGGGPPWEVMLGSSNVARARWWSSLDWQIGPDDFMDIQFKNGAIYRVYGVSEKVWNDFKNAPSYGKFYWAVIRSYGRDDQYKVRRLQ